MAACFCRAARECRSDHLAPENPAVLGFPPRGNSRFPDPFPIPGGKKHTATHEGWLYVLVGPPGIEPGLYAPHAHVLPVYYGPPSLKLRRASPLSRAFSLLLSNYYLPPTTYCFLPWSGCTWCRPGLCRRGAWRTASWPAYAANWWGYICRGAWFVLRPSGILFRRSRTVSLE